MTTFIIVSIALIALQIATDRLISKQKKIHQVEKMKQHDHNTETPSP